MSNVLLLALAIVSFILQVGYSVYYSVNVVDISTKVNQIQNQLETEQILVADLKAKFFQTTSISNLQLQQSTSLKPITKSLNLVP
jgi:hypothetical protein